MAVGASKAGKKVFIELENEIIVPVRHFPFTIGRNTECDLCVPYALISRNHCELFMKDSKLYLEDTSTNGTLAGNTLLNRKRAVIPENTTIVLGLDCLLKLHLGSIDHLGVHSQHDSGICIVDICDSTEMKSSTVDEICTLIRNRILLEDSGRIELLKNTGDGYMIVYSTPEPALAMAKRMLSLVSETTRDFQLRVTLDAGETTSTRVSSDLLGEAIIRATRLEKTQRGDLVEESEHADKLLVSNRCLMTESFREHMPDKEKDRCLLIGKTKFKGFGDTLHKVYQYQH